MLQHVNNAIYLHYFETARINFFNQELPNWDWAKSGIILLKNIVEYKVPVFLTDVCNVEIECAHIGTKSFTFTYKIQVLKDKNVITKTIGESILVCYDFTQEETINLPSELRNALQRHKI
jgi:acyl-CoA thioester hydrolase